MCFSNLMNFEFITQKYRIGLGEVIEHYAVKQYGFNRAIS